MRQLCNISYVLQLRPLSDIDAKKFEMTLNRPPAGWTRSRNVRSYVTPELDALMAPPGGAVGR